MRKSIRPSCRNAIRSPTFSFLSTHTHPSPNFSRRFRCAIFVKKSNVKRLTVARDFVRAHFDRIGAKFFNPSDTSTPSGSRMRFDPSFSRPLTTTTTAEPRWWYDHRGRRPLFFYRFLRGKKAAICWDLACAGRFGPYRWGWSVVSSWGFPDFF